MESTITVIIQIEVHEEYVISFQSITREEVQHRASFEGCLRAELFQEESQPNKFILIEQFTSQQMIDDYYDSIEYMDWHEKVSPWIRMITGSDYVPIAQ